MNITSLLRNQALFTSRFIELAQHPNKENAFLLSLSPVLESFYKTLFDFCQQSALLKQITSEPLIHQWTVKHFVTQITPMISRTCGLELMSISKQNKIPGHTPEQRFQKFIELLQESDTASQLYEKYGDLKELLTVSVNYSLIAYIRFLSHLEQDWAELTNALLPDEPLQLIEICGGGDSHCQGKRVLLLKFKDEKQKIHKVVYKPRSLQVDLAFQELITWHNQHNSSLPLYRLQLFTKKDHGWSEFIEHTACESEGQIAVFYQRMGVLLALLHLLAGHDIHMENLIASGSHPVIIDLECLLKPHIARRPQELKTSYNTALISESLILPYKFKASKEHPGIDISAMGAAGGEESPFKKLTWKNMGTDKISMSREAVKIGKFQNQPFIENLSIDLNNQASALMAGFAQGYQIIMENRELLQSRQSPLQAFKTAPIRVLLRSTSDYAKLLYESYHPRLFYFSKERQVHFDWLKKINKYFLFYKSIIRSEMHDLSRSDIPFFYTTPAEKTLYSSSGKKIDIPIIKSGWQVLQTKLKTQFNAADFNLQKQIIHNSFAAMQMANPQRTTPPVQYSQHSENPHLKQRAEHCARECLDHLEKLSITLYGQPVWPTISLKHINTWNPGLTGVELYDGSMGIAMAFACAGKVLHQPRYLRIAKKCLLNLQDLLMEKSTGLNPALDNLGFHSGIGGLIFAVGFLAEFFPAINSNAILNKLIKLTLPLIQKDEILDIVSGSAGLLIALYPLRSKIDKNLWKKLTRGCISQILKQYPDPAQLGSASKSMPFDLSQPLIGFAHGTSGFIAALSLYEFVYPDMFIAQWIQKALAYERLHFDAKRKNWPDFRYNNFTSAWCHGAPGVGLSRLFLMNNPEYKVESEVDAALASTLRSLEKADNISLCHGALGNYEFLLQVRDRFPEKISQQTLENNLNHILIQIEQNGFSELLEGKGGIVGLMTGVAGVAYQLLRVVNSKRIPSIL